MKRVDDAERVREILMNINKGSGVQIIGVEDKAIKDRRIEFSVLVA